MVPFCTSAALVLPLCAPPTPRHFCESEALFPPLRLCLLWVNFLCESRADHFLGAAAAPAACVGSRCLGCSPTGAFVQIRTRYCVGLPTTGNPSDGWMSPGCLPCEGRPEWVGVGGGCLPVQLCSVAPCCNWWELSMSPALSVWPGQAPNTCLLS